MSTFLKQLILIASILQVRGFPLDREENLMECHWNGSYTEDSLSNGRPLIIWTNLTQLPDIPSKITQTLTISSGVNKTHHRLVAKQCVWEGDELLLPELLPVNSALNPEPSLLRGVKEALQEANRASSVRLNPVVMRKQIISHTTIKPDLNLQDQSTLMQLKTRVDYGGLNVSTGSKIDSLLRQNRAELTNRYKEELSDLSTFTRSIPDTDPKIRIRRSVQFDDPEWTSVVNRRERLLKYHQAIRDKSEELTLLSFLGSKKVFPECNPNGSLNLVITCLDKIKYFIDDTESLFWIYQVGSNIIDKILKHKIELQFYQNILEN
ncbi:unknown precursor [Drosophila obscura sigmavirus 10A]|uniref:Uncharacterized protein n=1 Tax=Drosophila obscura sigmavirus TaxID=948741 RepID=C8CJE8_9RHAB|nr:unknown precursor [Drosophila obscura sigmavirus 10A]ACU65441.1 unknown precursor [Drosophila obscura sigmavirus 10A]